MDTRSRCFKRLLGSTCVVGKEFSDGRGVLLLGLDK